MSNLLEKLKKIAQYSDGIFITGQVISSNSDRKYLFNFMKRYPDYFSIIDNKKTKIIQLTQAFNDIQLSPKKVINNFTSTQIIQRILWTGLILQESFDRGFPYDYFKWGKFKFIIDPMEKSIHYYDSLKKKHSIQGVITITPRLKFFKTINLWGITPILCKKTWVKNHLSLYYSNNISLEELKLHPKNKIDNFIKNGIWPKNIDDCHKDKRVYPGIVNPVTGPEKWRMDKVIIELGKQLPENYLLGLFNLDSM